MGKNTPDSGILRQFAPHILVVLIFIALALLYFYPQLEGKTLQQSDISQWRGMVQELDEFAQNNPGVKAVWSGSMFSGMPSYHFGIMGYSPNYLGYIQQGLSLSSPGSMGPVFTGLLCAYILFFLLTGYVRISLFGSIAYAFSSYNLIILVAGHVTKAWAIAFIPLVLAGFLVITQKKYLMGGALFALGLGLELISGHIQITYYLAIFFLILFVGYAVHCLRKKEMKTLFHVSLTLFIALIFAVLPRLAGLYADFEMSKESMRGPSELTSSSHDNSTASEGLDIDYAFTWSYGKGETLSLMIPNIRGGASGGFLGQNSNLYKEFKLNDVRTGKEIQSYTYWGDQPFTSGPVYFGAGICFLFILGMFVIKNKIKWWLLGATLFFILLSWGTNLAWFNNFLFYHLPMYNKFRTPSMTLVIPSIIFPLVSVWGLKTLFHHRNDVEKERLKKQLLFSLGITGITCLVLWLMAGVFFNFESGNDSQFLSEVPDWYYNALLADRESLLKSDALRSFIFILLFAASIFFFMNKSKKQFYRSLTILVVLVLIDLWTVDKRYLNESSFEKKKSEKVFEPTIADNIILKDKSPSYRVLNISANTFNETATSYFHKSIGGYHAAKLRRYQELIDRRINGEIQFIGQSFQNANSIDDVIGVFQNTPTINMLNAKYIIYNPNQEPIVNPNAGGNAWFIQEVMLVDNADEELDALNTIDPRKTAVVDKKFADQIEKQSFTPDSAAFIELLQYQPIYLKYSSKTNSEQLAVFSEIYYSNGWKAFIDGKPAEHFRTDWVLRAMNVPAGEHIIEFRFEPDTFNTLSNIGSMASLLLIIGFAGTLIYSGRNAWRKAN
ncbi:MAG: hypothetical protein LBP83_06400 [Dysgonamonadaceae bacterium]|jgi:hypothetical protein|nr:hypothetical protein [Dysgonamonadaceae bacterium]